MAVPHQLGPRRAAAAKLGIGAEVLALLMVVAWDFGNALRESERLASAARAGARYGVQDTKRWTDYAGMTQAARDDAKDASNSLIVVAQQACTCPGGRPVSCRDTCAGEPYPRMYVKVITSEKYSPLLSYPLVGNSITLSSQVMMRVQ